MRRGSGGGWADVEGTAVEESLGSAIDEDGGESGIVLSLTCSVVVGASENEDKFI